MVLFVQSFEITVFLVYCRSQIYKVFLLKGVVQLNNKQLIVHMHFLHILYFYNYIVKNKFQSIGLFNILLRDLHLCNNYQRM